MAVQSVEMGVHQQQMSSLPHTMPGAAVAITECTLTSLSVKAIAMPAKATAAAAASMAAAAAVEAVVQIMVHLSGGGPRAQSWSATAWAASSQVPSHLALRNSNWCEAKSQSLNVNNMHAFLSMISEWFAGCT